MPNEVIETMDHLIVGVCASADKFDAVLEVLRRTIPDSQLSIVLVVRPISVDDSSFAERLRTAGILNVMEAADGQVMMPGNVYLVPDNVALQIHSGRLMVKSENDERESLDCLLTSLALHHGEHSIAVVLSDNDIAGEIGFNAIREAGGTIITCSPLADGDLVLPPDAIGAELVKQSRLVERHPQSIVERLEQELASTQAELLHSKQAMNAANEELLTMNAELQVANENLATSRDDVQAGSDELAQANADLRNLLRSTKIATLFLDEELQIRRFTPEASSIYHLVDSDIGRPLSQLQPLTDEMPPLPTPSAVRTVGSCEDTIRMNNGQTYMRRILPYSSPDGTYDGVVVTFTNITQLRQRDQQIQDRERQLKTVTDAVPVMIAYVKADYCYEFVNAAFAQHFKMPASEMIGKTVREVAGDASFSKVEFKLAQTFEGAGQQYEFELQSAGGEVRTFQMTHVVEYDEDNVAGAYVVGTDITERKRAAQKVLESRNQMRLALDAGKMGSWDWVLSSDELVFDSAQHQLFGSNPDKNLSLDELFERIYPDDRNWLRQRLDQAVENRADWLEEFRIVHPEKGVRWIAARGRVFTDKKNNPTQMSGVNWDTTDERNTEEENVRLIRESEHRLRTFIDNSPAMAGVVELPDDDSDVLHVIDNAATEKFFGVDSGETSGRWAVADLNVPAEVARDWIANFRRGKAAGQTLRWQFQLPSDELFNKDQTDSSQCWIVSVSYVGSGLDGRQRFCYTAVDDSERFRAVEKLTASESRYRSLTQVTSAGIFWTDPSGQITARQLLLHNITGMEFDAAKGLGWLDAIHSDDRDEFRKQWLSGVQGKRSIAAQFRLFHESYQEHRHVELRAVAIQDKEGHVAQWVVGLRDIHQQSQTEKQLRDSQNQLRLALDAADLALWQWDIDADQIRRFDNVDEHAGIDAETTVGTAIGTPVGSLNEYLSLVHPDDRDRVKRQLDESLRSGEPHRCEFRMRREISDEQPYRLVLSMARLMFDENNKPIKMIGVEMDMTDRTKIGIRSADSK